ncbi:hypothetical protein HUJ04_006877 [Dendroctonus ponderosae]|nr:hypothetical protein HUJ04_006877 [Dendroctonus ponderosae]
MDSTRIVKIACDKSSLGHKSIGRPRKRWSDNARIDLRYTNLLKFIYRNATLQVHINEDIQEEGDTMAPKLFTLIQLSEASKHVGMNMNSTKTKIMSTQNTNVTIEGQDIEKVKESTWDIQSCWNESDLNEQQDLLNESEASRQKPLNAATQKIKEAREKI